MHSTIGAEENRTVGIAVICKTPEAGKCKTRLSPPLLPEQCAELSACFIQDLTANIESLCAGGALSGYALYTPAGTERRLRELLPDNFGLIPQVDGDLGARLLAGAEDVLARGHHGVIIVNADSPTLPPAILQDAAERLLEEDCVVLGPAIDGGYTLIGLSCVHRRLFQDIPWSTGRVHSLTEARASEIGLAVRNVAPWYDVDDAASLEMLRRELRGEHPPFAMSRHAFAAAPATRDYLAAFPTGMAASIPHHER